MFGSLTSGLQLQVIWGSSLVLPDQINLHYSVSVLTSVCNVQLSVHAGL